jgi:hypothetical protein
MTENLNNILNKLYKNRGYFEKHSFDLILSFLIILFIILGCLYYYVMSIKPLVEKDWVLNQCNPIYMPFAGLIKKKQDQSVIEATEENYNNCISNIQSEIVNDALQPLYYTSNVVGNSLSETSDSINALRSILSNIRNSITTITNNIYQSVLNVALPLSAETINAQDTLSKITGVLTSSLYQGVGVGTTVFSFGVGFNDALQGFLIFTAAAIVALWVTAIFFFPAAIAATAATFGYVALLIPSLMVIMLLSIIFKYNGGGTPPPVPANSCFDSETLIEMNNNTFKKIIDIEPGEYLKNNNKVTAKMKSLLGKNKIYNYKDILVTGCHKVKVDNKWIRIDNHKDASIINDYYKNTVYCLNTEQKIIEISGDIFMDWDEIDDDELDKLNKFTDNNIEKVCNKGYNSEVNINFENKIIKLKDIELNHNLGNNNIVISIVKLSDNKINLKTSKGYFYIENNKINDYDYLIENILSI